MTSATGNIHRQYIPEICVGVRSGFGLDAAGRSNVVSMRASQAGGFKMRFTIIGGMQCRQCGTEIADKAIICFRCGAGTTDPVRKAVPVKPRRAPIVPLVAIVALVASALYLWQVARTAANPEMPQLAAGLALGAAVVVLVLGVLRRR
jgi:hypothetical protein